MRIKDMSTKDLFRLAASCGALASDREGVEWVWAGHALEQVQGDGTAECEELVLRGVLAPREIEECDCGCPDRRCYVYRVIETPS